MSAHLTDADRTLSEELTQRWPAVRPFAAAGSVCIVAGGLVAAVTRPSAPVVRAAYRGVVAVILLSAPVGVALAWIRHG